MGTVADDFDSIGADGELNGRSVSDGSGKVWSCSVLVIKGGSGGTNITSNTTAGRGPATVDWTPAGTDYSVAGTIYASSTGKQPLFLMARLTGGNYVMAGWGGGGSWSILNRDGGGDHVLASGSTTNPPTTARACVLTISGVSPNIAITLTSDGTTVASVSGVNNTAMDPKGLAGVLNYFSDVGSGTEYIDNWSATDTAAGAAVIPLIYTRRRFASL